MTGFEGIGDFEGDPYERYIAHQAAKGNYGPWATPNDPRILQNLEAEVDTYSIVRFRFNEENTVLYTGKSLEEAQEWCNREDSHNADEGQFDGYRREE